MRAYLVIIVFSFHLDHCGALPFLLLKTGIRAKCYMTHATKAIYRYLLADFVRVRYASYLQIDLLVTLELLNKLYIRIAILFKVWKKLIQLIFTRNWKLTA